MENESGYELLEFIGLRSIHPPALYRASFPKARAMKVAIMSLFTALLLHRQLIYNTGIGGFDPTG